MKFRYLFGLSYDELHTRFYRRHFQGEVLRIPEGRLEAGALEKIRSLDGPDTVWFFTQGMAPVLEFLCGRKVLLHHGAGLVAPGHPMPAELINRHVDAVFESNRQHLRHDIGRGVRTEKLKEIGEPLFLQIPKLPVRENSLLLTETAFTPWHPHKITLEILKRLESVEDVRLCFHPLLEEKKKEELRQTCRARTNLRCIETDEELFEAFAVCRLGLGQYGSLAAPFWYQNKPWIFVRGPMTGLRPLRGWNPLKGFGWLRACGQMRDSDFNRILSESSKVSRAGQVTEQLLRKAPVSPSARALFFEWNHDEKEMLRRIQGHLESLF